MEWLDVFTLLSFFALTADILFQIRNIYTRHSSEDISLTGLSIRYSAILFLLYKFYTLSEWPLMIGQGMLATVFTLYLVLAFHYHRHKLPTIWKRKS
jgi:hypothetical protein